MVDLAQGQGCRDQRQRRVITIRGAVQGVGFRPFVYQWARQIGITGWIANTSFGVIIEAEGPEIQLREFVQGIALHAPPLARIESLTEERVKAVGYQGFVIRESQAQAGESVSIVPDLSICADCTRELLEPSDRRFRYPFINCTNCGPRFTIIRDIPYDRPLTTMDAFPMCPDCDHEYHDPMDRRFHAQPDACAQCGPELSWLESDHQSTGNESSLEQAAQALLTGKIVAIKGLGGFHLACLADDDQAVLELRQRKHRWGKPLAVMMSDVEMVRQYCQLSQVEEELLCSQRRPIVLLAKSGQALAPSVSPGVSELGVMLPYTPLHLLLTQAVQRPLVMTSGNLSEEPLCKDNDEAQQRLAAIADAFLMHNRGIESRCDDSLMRVFDEAPLMLRRARGYAPEPFFLDQDGPDLLAAGPEQKNTFCLVKGRKAILSPHLGDLDNTATMDHYIEMLGKLSRLFRVSPQVVACDLHPGYGATQYAKTMVGVELVEVQHHHAHIAACMAEHHLQGPVIGVAYDGTGLGSDGTIWGGELLIANLTGFTRAASLAPTPLPGGDQAIRHPARMAAAYLTDHLGLMEAEWPEPLRRAIGSNAALLEHQIKTGLNSPLSSSMGRLFDGVGALLGNCTRASYEGQAAVELETLAARGDHPPYPFQLDEAGDRTVVSVTPIMAAILDDLNRGIDRSVIAARFHATVAAFTLDLCLKISQDTGIRIVCLGGGVWQNRRLLSATVVGLRQLGLTPYWAQMVPINDGGIAFGQAAVARARRGPLSV